MEEVVGIHCRWGWFPNDNVPEKSRCGREIPPDGSEVEWGDGIDKTFKRAVLYATVNEICVSSELPFMWRSYEGNLTSIRLVSSSQVAKHTSPGHRSS